VLGKTLGMDLEITSSEHPIGGFALDLIGRNLGTGESVIIENQLEGTDHAHLGQLLTYAAGADAANIVWLARNFREEHRAALDWLNSRTDAETRFFGVEIGAVRIGDSDPAPLFQLVAEPNDWRKTAKTSTQARAGGGEKPMLYAAFWDRYLAALRDANLSWSRATKGPQDGWVRTSAGLSGAGYTVSFGRRGLKSELFFDHPDPAVNTRRFGHLLALRPKLEAAYGGPLHFEPLDTRKGCRITDLTPGDILDQSAWPTYIAWFIDTQRRLRAAVTAAGGIPAATTSP